MKTDIKIAFKNFWDGFEYQQCPFYIILSKNYNVEVVDEVTEDIDLLFLSCYYWDGFDATYFMGTVKTVSVLYENLYPNFDAHDYSISYYNIGYERNLRLPLYWYYDYMRWEKFGMNNKYLFKHEPNLSPEIFDEKTNHIAMAISNPYRDGMSYLNTLIDNFDFKSGGDFYHNTDIGRNYKPGANYNDKLELFKTCKFGIAFENADNDDYVTEKIYDCYISNTIPIYFGADNIGNDFNPESFINVKNYSSPNEMIEHIDYLMHNKDAYMEMINKKRVLKRINYTAKCEDFLINIIENGKIYNHVYGGLMWSNYGGLYREKNNLII